MITNLENTQKKRINIIKENLSVKVFENILKVRRLSHTNNSVGKSLKKHKPLFVLVFVA